MDEDLKPDVDHLLAREHVEAFGLSEMSDVGDEDLFRLVVWVPEYLLCVVRVCSDGDGSVL